MGQCPVRLLGRPWGIILVYFVFLYTISKHDFLHDLNSDSEAELQNYESEEEKFSPDALEKLKDKANHYRENGDHAKAIPILKELHNRQAEIFGPEDTKTVETLELLAIQFVPLKKYDEGLPLYWQIYKIKEKTLGPTHLETLDALQNLAQVYQLKGKYEKAAGFFKVIYKQRKMQLGPEHVKTMEILFLLANALASADKSIEMKEKVLKYYRQVYKVYSRTWGENDHTLFVLSEIGQILLSLQQFEEAVPILRTIMKATEKRPQSDLYEIAEMLLGWALSQLGRTEEARQVHKTARRIKNQKGKETCGYGEKIQAGGKFTPEVEDQIAAVLNLARVAMAEQNFEKALEKLEGLYSIIQNDHPKSNSIVQSLVKMYSALSNFKMAFAMSIELFHVVHKDFNKKEHEKIIEAWTNAVVLYMKVMENKDECEDEQLFSPKLKDISKILVNTLKLSKIDRENPQILKVLAMAAHLAESEPEIAVSAASKLIPIFKQSREAEPKPSQEEMEKINKEIIVFQNILDENQNFEHGEKSKIQNLLYKVEL